MKKTIIDLFEGSVEKYGAKTFLLEKKHRAFEPTTYAETKELALETGAGLAAIGIRPKDKVAILAEGSNAWIVSELGMFYAGAVSVPLSVKLEESNDLLFRMRHAEVKALFVSKYQLPKIRRIRAELPEVKHIIVIGHIPLEPGETALGTLRRLGRDYLSKHREEFLAIGRGIGNDDYATITYTSGTTADPKGVVLTHRNYTANVEQSLSRIDIPSSFRTLIILPLDHCFAHVVGFYIMIACGATVATVQVGATPMETLKNIPQNIREVRPHFLLSVPALAKNFRKNIEGSIRAKGRFTERLFNLALRTAYLYNKDGYGRGQGWRVLLWPAVRLFDAVLFRKVREAFGGSLRFFVGGGALLDAELQRFFYAIGIPMFQGYGLSEATPVISTNSPKYHWHRFGSSGKILIPLDLKIVDEAGREVPRGEKGEIVIRGENVMAGYWKNPEASAETVRDGWLHTGDMGYVSKRRLPLCAGPLQKPADRFGRRKIQPRRNGGGDRGQVALHRPDHHTQQPESVYGRHRRAEPRSAAAGAGQPRNRGRKAGGDGGGDPRRRNRPLPGRRRIRRGVPRTLAAGGAGHRGRAVHRAERAGEQHHEGRAQQGGSAFRRPSRLPLHARRPQSQKCEKPRIAEKNRGVKVNLPPRNLEKSKNAEYICTPKCGSSSVVEHQLPKLRVAGSTPVSRS